MSYMDKFFFKFRVTDTPVTSVVKKKKTFILGVYCFYSKLPRNTWLGTFKR